MRIVLDTNVVLDWLVFGDPALEALRQAVRRGSVTICTHPLAVDELRRVLHRPELGLNGEKAGEVLEQYGGHALPVSGAGDQAVAQLQFPAGFARCRDPDDDLFLALALHSGADALVSRDKALLALRKKCRAFGFAILSVPELAAALVPP